MCQLPDAPNNILEGFRQLCDLLRNEENLFWKRVETFLLISTGLVGILGIFGQASRPGLNSVQNMQLASSGSLFGIIICAMGIVICLFWLFVVRRSEAFYNHWYEQLMFLEDKYFAPLRVFNTAEEYFEKGIAKIGDKEFKLGRVSKIARIYQAMTIIAAVFLLVWIIILSYLFYLYRA